MKVKSLVVEATSKVRDLALLVDKTVSDFVIQNPEASVKDVQVTGTDLTTAFGGKCLVTLVYEGQTQADKDLAKAQSDEKASIEAAKQDAPVTSPSAAPAAPQQ